MEFTFIKVKDCCVCKQLLPCPAEAVSVDGKDQGVICDACFESMDPRQLDRFFGINEYTI